MHPLLCDEPKAGGGEPVLAHAWLLGHEHFQFVAAQQQPVRDRVGVLGVVLADDHPPVVPRAAKHIRLDPGCQRQPGEAVEIGDTVRVGGPGVVVRPVEAECCDVARNRWNVDRVEPRTGQVGVVAVGPVHRRVGLVVEAPVGNGVS